MGLLRKLWSSVVLVVGLGVARGCIRLGMWFARRGDKLGNHVMRRVAAIGQRQEQARERDHDQDDETPDERHGTENT